MIDLVYKVSVIVLAALGVPLLAGILRELAIARRERRALKLDKLRKKANDFLDAGAKVFERPIAVAELTEDLVKKIEVIAQGSLVGLDIYQQGQRQIEARKTEDAKRAAVIAAAPTSGKIETALVAPGSPSPSGLPVAGAPATVPHDDLFGVGANGGAPVVVTGRVDMGDDEATRSLAGRPRVLGAASSPDGTA